MYEKILQKLKEQRGQTSSISDRSLEDLAKSLTLIISTEEILGKTDFTGAIRSLEGNISHYTAEQVRKAKEDAEKADKVKKDAELAEAAKKKKEEEDAKKVGDVPEYVKVLMEQTKAIMEQNKLFGAELSALKTDKVVSSRAERLKKSLEGIPPYVANPILSAFNKTTFNSDEDFDGYLKEVEKNKGEFEQAAKEQGLNTYSPATPPKKSEETGESPLIADARKMVLEQKEKENKVKQ